jgi:hypothetical protein
MTRQWTAAVLLMVAGINGARAEDYPARTVTMIVPFAAGGPADVTGRIVADIFSRHLGQKLRAPFLRKAETDCDRASGYAVRSAGVALATFQDIASSAILMLCVGVSRSGADRGDHPIGNKSLDVDIAVAVLRQDLFRVLSKLRRVISNGRHIPVIPDRMTQETHVTGDRMVDVHDHTIPPDLGIPFYVRVIVYGGMPDTVLSENRHPFGSSLFHHFLDDQLVDFLTPVELISSRISCKPIVTECFGQDRSWAHRYS